MFDGSYYACPANNGCTVRNPQYVAAGELQTFNTPQTADQLTWVFHWYSFLTGAVSGTPMLLYHVDLEGPCGFIADQNEQVFNESRLLVQQDLLNAVFTATDGKDGNPDCRGSYTLNVSVTDLQTGAVYKEPTGHLSMSQVLWDFGDDPHLVQAT